MADSPSRIGRWIAVALAILAMATALYQVVVDNTPKGELRTIKEYQPWSPETIAAAEDIPVQDGGRIKPLATYAGFTMLSLHGARSMEITDDKGETHKLKPLPWLLDALFRPAFAIHQPTFRVDNSSAIEAIGLTPLGKRDRYSYADLRPGREKLGELFQSYRGIESDKRDPVQNQIVTLASNVMAYENLLGYFTFARNGITLVGSGDANTADKRADTSAIMATAPLIREQLQSGGMDQPHMQGLLQQVLDASNFAKFGLVLIPPTANDSSHWLSAGVAIMETMNGTAKNPETIIDDVRALEQVARLATADDREFRSALLDAKKRFTDRAASRGEGKSISLEAAYYHINWFLYALVWFLLGTLSTFFMWLAGSGRVARIASWITIATTLAGLTYCTIAIVKRCIIMQRPPVGNLYDTIIFIATTMVMLALFVEWLTRRRFALGLAPIIGTTLILLARRFELGDATDHMDPLVAVLDSNFWLTTHVITITYGYATGYFAAFVSAVFILVCGLRLVDEKNPLRRILTRTTYGVICFTLFLSLVGTVLGGIWANYSWGRFWGWDPKENGALLIVLWCLAILHARLGGYLREWGIHLASLFTAIIVTFSWWHVNFLGVGLHNYGFTAGKNTIWAFYAVISAILLFGTIAWILEATRSAKSKNRPSAPQPASSEI
jgi:ABC-type transport system involved in cytochrome c biogenesis permease subunit